MPSFIFIYFIPSNNPDLLLFSRGLFHRWRQGGGCADCFGSSWRQRGSRWGGAAKGAVPSLFFVFIFCSPQTMLTVFCFCVTVSTSGVEGGACGLLWLEFEAEAGPCGGGAAASVPWARRRGSGIHLSRGVARQRHLSLGHGTMAERWCPSLGCPGGAAAASIPWVRQRHPQINLFSTLL